MRKLVIQRILTLLGFVLFVAIMYLTSMHKSNKYLNNLFSEYPLIEIEQSIYAKVYEIAHVNKNLVRDIPSDVFIKLDNSRKCHISVLPANKGPNLQDVIKLGSIVIKKQGEGKIEIFNIVGSDTARFEFEICDYLGYPKEDMNHLNKK